MTKHRRLIALVATLLALSLSLVPAGLAEDAPPPQSPPIRVALAWAKPSLTVTASGGFTAINDATGGVIAGGATTLTFNANAVGVGIEGFGTFSGPISIRPDTAWDGSVSYLTYAAKRYRGTFSVVRDSGGQLTLVNTLPLEDYLLGVVPREMPADWPAEALNAQAVAARTYAYSRLPSGQGQLFDVYNTILSQVYGGFDGEDARASAAVQATAGMIATYGGSPISALFFSTSGGFTENNENVYTSVVPYLRGVVDYDQDSPHNQWTVSYSVTQLQQLLTAGGYDVGTLYQVVPEEPGVSGRWSQVTLKGSKGSKTLSANAFRIAVGSTVLKSTWFTLVRNDDRMADVLQPAAATTPVTVIGSGGRTGSVIPAGAAVVTASGIKTVNAGDFAPPSSVNVVGKRFVPAALTFNGRGYGHGVGLSQWGARGMALQGYNYQDILTHYYTGIQLERR